LPKESVRTALNRRHHRRFSPENCEPPPPNTPPSVLLRPNRHRRRPQGEALVRLDPSPSFPSRRSTLPGRPSPVSGSWSSWAMPQPTRPAWSAYEWASGPSSQCLGSL
jgi:hypothetical protein